MCIDTDAISQLRGTRRRSVSLGFKKGVILRRNKNDNEKALVRCMAACQQNKGAAKHQYPGKSHTVTFPRLARLRNKAGINRACTRNCN